MPERRIQMKSCKEMAKQWGVTERTVTTFCKTGKIPGVVKAGGFQMEQKNLQTAEYCQESM